MFAFVDLFRTPGCWFAQKLHSDRALRAKYDTVTFKSRCNLGLNFCLIAPKQNSRMSGHNSSCRKNGRPVQLRILAAV